MKDTQENRARFGIIINGMANNFGHGKLSKDDLTMRFMALQEYELNAISQAATWLIKNRKPGIFPAIPTTKEIIDAIEGVTTSPDIRVIADQQANQVLKAMKYAPPSVEVTFEHPVTAHLMQTRWSIGSLRRTMQEADEKWFRREFVEAFILYNAPENLSCLTMSDGSPNKLAHSVKTLLPELTKTMP